MVTHLPGDFQLCPMGGKAGSLIRFAQWLNGDGFHDYEHVRLYIGPAQRKGYGVFVEAMPDKARKAEFPLDPPGVYWSSGKIALTPQQRAEIVRVALIYVGTPYSFVDYLALAAHRLHIYVPGIKRYVASSKHMICSQLIDQCYLDAGVHLFKDDRWPGYVTPGDLYHLLER